MPKHKQGVYLIYLVTLGVTFFWLSTIFLAPYLKNHSPAISRLIYAAFAPICHQISSRCFFAFGQPLAVCARCLGIYIGFFTGTAIFPLLKGFSHSSLPRARTLAFFSAPIALDTFWNLLSLWRSPGEVRFVTGLIWGIVLPFYFIPGMTDCVLRKRRIDDTTG